MAQRETVPMPVVGQYDGALDVVDTVGNGHPWEMSYRYHLYCRFHTIQLPAPQPRAWRRADYHRPLYVKNGN